MKAVKNLCLIFLLISPAINVQAWPWPDTGQTKCYNDTVEIACPAPGQPFYGQDAQCQGPTRSYTKLGQNGVALSDSATQSNGWVMTRDNVTGLIWENKTSDGSIHDKDKAFTWCDKHSATNGGYQGFCGTGTGDAATDTEAFIQALNYAHYGGFSDWRMPTIKELSSLVNSAFPYPGPTIDTTWFPNTVSNFYSSSTTSADVPRDAWIVVFYSGVVLENTKNSYDYVRAVRAEQ
jgi:hypothetical protein